MVGSVEVVEVVERQGVAVLAQGGAGFGVTEALLGLLQMAVGHEHGRDGVMGRVQAYPRVSVAVDELPEPVSQPVGAWPGRVVRSGREQTRPEAKPTSTGGVVLARSLTCTFMSAPEGIQTPHLLIRSPEGFVILGAGGSVRAHLVLLGPPAPSGWCARVPDGARGSVSNPVSKSGRC